MKRIDKSVDQTDIDWFDNFYNAEFEVSGIPVLVDGWYRRRKSDDMIHDANIDKTTVFGNVVTLDNEKLNEMREHIEDNGI